MDIKNICLEFPEIAPFSPKDQTDIDVLFSSSPMRLAGLNLVYERSPDFMALLRAQGGEQVSLVGRHNSQLFGLASFSFSKRFIGGKVQNVGYLGDMRIQPSKLSTRLWRDAYPKLLRSGNSYFYTAILSQNELAKRSLVKQKRDSGFRYDFLKKVRMINLLMKKPWARVRSNFFVRNAQDADQKSVKEFLDNFNRKLHLGYCFKEFEWDHRKSNWPNWCFEDFLIIERNNNILAVTLPWAPTTIKRMKINHCPSTLRVTNLFSKLLGAKSLVVGESLSTLYLTHFAWDSSIKCHEAADAFITYLSSSGVFKRHNFVSYAEQDLSEPPAKSFFSFSLDVDLYSVRLTDQSVRQPIDSLIGFEMATV
ncbi:MAG: hypothetical protein A4S09_00750 [Proteobacteria bacterium SG_bin7]|nr:MAG: hypothetical protein A4S09_00750 [Proteobacteria bacterium SG_bin7]